MERIHADRVIAPTLSIMPDLAALCDAQDLDEVLGNLLDNAWRHAASRVHVSAQPVGRLVRLTIADDGTALTEDRLRDLRAGAVRVDEGTASYGQGIRIARELIELHGGALAFARAQIGGLEVQSNCLPRACESAREAV